MQAAELRQAKRLLGQLERLHEAWRQREATPRFDDEANREKTNSIQAKIDTLAATVLARALGIERYMVLHLVRDDGYESRFQVLSMGILWGWTYDGVRWMWQFEGRRLRKDGTLGHLPGGMSLDAGLIERRCLDGAWVALTLRTSNEA